MISITGSFGFIHCGMFFARIRVLNRSSLRRARETLHRNERSACTSLRRGIVDLIFEERLQREIAEVHLWQQQLLLQKKPRRRRKIFCRSKAPTMLSFMSGTPNK